MTFSSWVLVLLAAIGVFALGIVAVTIVFAIISGITEDKD